MELSNVMVVPDRKSNGNCNREMSENVSQLTANNCRQANRHRGMSSSNSLLRAERGHSRNRRRERLNTELLEASVEGDILKISRLVQEGASVNATCRQSCLTALHLAVWNDCDTAVSTLINLGSDIELRDSFGRQPVHFAAWNCNQKILELFSQAKKEILSSPIRRIEVQVADDNIDSWNHKHENIMDYLTEFSGGSTPLHLVCKRSNLPLVTYLINEGVSVNDKDDEGLSPLDVVGSMNIELVGYPTLPDSNSELGSPGQDEPPSSTPSFDSIPFTFPSKISKLSLKRSKKIHKPILEEGSNIRNDSDLKKNCVTGIAKVLLGKGATMPVSQFKEGTDKNATNRRSTALHTAVKDNNLELVKMLLEQNGCMFTWDERGYTPLHIAVENQAVESLKAMLEFKDDLSRKMDARDSQGNTILHFAVMTEWEDGVCLLLDHGADVKTVNGSNENVLHLAAERNSLKILQELLSIADSYKVINVTSSEGYTPLCKAVLFGYLDCAKLLVENGGNPQIILPGERTLLHFCTEKNYFNLLHYLINETSANELKDRICHQRFGGITPLHSAAMLGNYNCVATLLGANCDFRIKSTEQPHLSSTAVHFAARNGHDNVISKLLDYDNELLFQKDSLGWYPLHIAASNGYAKCVSTMIDYGADLSDYIVDEKGVYLTGLEIIIYCIPQPSDFLVGVFDSFIKTNEFPVSDPKCKISVKFDVLAPKNYCKQLSVLNAILNCGNGTIQQKLLLHPIVQTFLHLKWMNLRLFFFIIMMLYLIFTVSLTIFSVWYYILKNDQTPIVSAVHGIFYVSLVPIILTEALSVMQLQRHYIYDSESWVKWTVIISAIIVGQVDPSLWWARHLTAITLLLAWLELLFLVARCPNWGFYVLMFSRVAVKVFKVLITFTFLLVGFTLAFMIQFDSQEPFTTLWQSTIKVFIMMIEFDYEATFENMDDSDFLSFVSRAMFLFFVILVAIVLMNLMIGLAVSDITVLENQGRTQRLAKQVSFLNLLELVVGPHSILSSMPDKIRNWNSSRMIVPEVVIRAGGVSAENNTSSLPRYLRDMITEKVTYSFSSDNESCKVSLGELVSRLDRIERRGNSSSSEAISSLKNLLDSQLTAVSQIETQLRQLVESRPSSNNFGWIPQPIDDNINKKTNNLF